VVRVNLADSCDDFGVHVVGDPRQGFGDVVLLLLDEVGPDRLRQPRRDDARSLLDARLQVGECFGRELRGQCAVEDLVAPVAPVGRFPLALGEVVEDFLC
jgi:hypothetical protein